MMHRRALLAAPGLAAIAPCAARAQAWPARPLRMIVGFPPGGAVDIAARLIADLLTPKLGQPVLVENRPGGSGTIGVTAVAQAAPDGYTLGAVAVNSLSIHPYLFARLPYDPERDLLPASLAWEAPLVLVVPAAHVPARTVAELVAWASDTYRSVMAAAAQVVAPLDARRFGERLVAEQREAQALLGRLGLIAP